MWHHLTSLYPPLFCLLSLQHCFFSFMSFALLSLFLLASSFQLSTPFILYSLHLHFINPFVVSLPSPVAPSTPSSCAVALSIPLYPISRPLEAELSINSIAKKEEHKETKNERNDGRNWEKLPNDSISEALTWMPVAKMQPSTRQTPQILPSQWAEPHPTP